MIFRECIDTLNVSLGHKGRENVGGVKVVESMEQFSISAFIFGTSSDVREDNTSNTSSGLFAIVPAATAA